MKLRVITGEVDKDTNAAITKKAAEIK
jgi:hypothetical protein